MESHIEVQYFRGGTAFGAPIPVDQFSAHPDITDFDVGDYFAWAKDLFSLVKDIYSGDFWGIAGDIATALKDVFQNKNKAAKMEGGVMLLAAGTVPYGGPAVDEARILFQASSEDDLTASFGSVVPEGKIIDLGENRYTTDDGISFYEKRFSVP